MLKLTVRPAQATDDAAIAHVHTQAFGQPDEAELVERIRQSDRNCPDLSLVAIGHNPLSQETPAQIVGHILLSRADLDGDQARPILALAPLGVLPAVQGQGIGSRLLQAALQAAQRRPEPLVVVLGHPRFYARFGFELAQVYQIQCPFPVPPEAFRVYYLPAYDATRDRGQVIYPPAFNTVTP